MKTATILFLLVYSFLISSAKLPGDDYPAPTQNDTASINELIGAVKKIIYIYPDSAMDMVKIILDSSEKYNYRNGMFNGINLKANLFNIRGHNKKALRYFSKALAYCDTMTYPRGQAVILSNLGLSYLNLSKIDSAIYYYNKALDFSLRHGIDELRNKVMYDLSLIYLEQSDYLNAYKKLVPLGDTFRIHNDTIHLILTYSSLGLLYTKLGNFDSAYHYYRKAIDLDDLFLSFDNRANTTNLGELYFRVKNDYDSALILYRKSIHATKQVNAGHYTNSANINIGNVHYEKQMFDSAYYYYSLVYNDPLTQYYPYRQSAVLINIGEYFRKKNDYKQSREYLEKGIELAESNGYIEFLTVGYGNLARLDSCEGNWYASLKNYKKYTFYHDSLNQLRDQNEISKLALDQYIIKKKYDTHILKQENALSQELIANQHKLLILFLVVLLILIPVVMMIYFNRRKIKKLLVERSLSHDALKKLTGKLKASNKELQRERKRLNELNKTKDKFYSIISHDLKGPIASFVGLLQIIQDNWENMPEEEKKDNINRLKLSANKTYELLRDILEWGKTLDGKLDYQTEVFNAYQNLSNVTELYHMQASGKEISIAMNVPASLEIQTDPRYFGQIIQNLLNNAIKFSYRGGKIRINYLETDDGIRFCVADEGTGIPEDKLDNIFSISSNYRMSGTENELSTGMGLILCKEYASIIHATLHVKSILSDSAKGLPGGSTFCLCFPSHTRL